MEGQIISELHEFHRLDSDKNGLKDYTKEFIKAVYRLSVLKKQNLFKL